MATDDLIDQMQSSLERYRNLRQHQADQQTFLTYLQQLQKWQLDRLLWSHRNLLAQPKYQSAAYFVLNDVYSGINLSELAHDMVRIVPKAGRVLPDRALNTAVHALELNTLTAELDGRLVEYLFYTLKVQHIDPKTYVKGLAVTASQTERQRQIELANLLGQGIDQYIASRMVYMAFKLAKKPIQSAGFGQIYEFIDKGFGVLKPLGSASNFLNKITQLETQIVTAIYNNQPDPYGIETHWQQFGQFPAR